MKTAWKISIVSLSVVSLLLVTAPADAAKRFSFGSSSSSSSSGPSFRRVTPSFNSSSVKRFSSPGVTPNFNSSAFKSVKPLAPAANLPVLPIQPSRTNPVRPGKVNPDLLKPGIFKPGLLKPGINVGDIKPGVLKPGLLKPFPGKGDGGVLEEMPLPGKGDKPEIAPENPNQGKPGNNPGFNSIPTLLPKKKWCTIYPQHCHWWYDYCFGIRHCYPRHCHVWQGSYVQIANAYWYLGVTGTVLPEKGLGITEVKAGSPAEGAGLRPGMVITQAGGLAIVDETSMPAAIAQSGGLLSMTVLPAADAQPVAVTVQMIRLVARGY